MQVPPPRKQSPHSAEYIDYCVDAVESGDVVPVLHEVGSTVQPVTLDPARKKSRWQLAPPEASYPSKGKLL